MFGVLSTEELFEHGELLIAEGLSIGFCQGPEGIFHRSSVPTGHGLLQAGKSLLPVRYGVFLFLLGYLLRGGGVPVL